MTPQIVQQAFAPRPRILILRIARSPSLGRVASGTEERQVVRWRLLR